MDRVRCLSGNFFDLEGSSNGDNESKKVDPSQRVLRFLNLLILPSLHLCDKQHPLRTTISD